MNSYRERLNERAPLRRCDSLASRITHAIEAGEAGGNDQSGSKEQVTDRYGQVGRPFGTTYPKNHPLRLGGCKSELYAGTPLEFIGTQGGENLMTETISRKEALAWLAGIIDGEGCIHAFWAKQQPHMTGPGMRINVLIGGCHPAMIARATLVLKACDIGFCVQTFQPKGGRKAAGEIVVAGKGRVKKLLTLTKPYLTEKLRQAELALELIEYRESLANVMGVQHPEKKVHLSKDPKIIGLIEEIKRTKNEFPSVLDFSRRAGEVLGSQSPETIRSRLRLDEVMIESELHGDMQTAAEMTVAHA